MSAFTEPEIAYLRSQTLGRVATIGADGQPHLVPVTYVFNADEDAIDIGGMNFGASKKWHDATGNPRVTFLVDDVIGPPRQARAVEVRGLVEAHPTGGESINPRFPGFAPEFLRLRPRRIVAWGIEQGGTDGANFRPNARSVSAG
jgi:pyridoxamine 5'-phosphate oxidase family protein